LSRTLLIFVLLAASAGRGEIIDRVVAVAGRRVITASDVDREARLEAYFNRLPPPLGALGPGPQYQATRERLIRQRLVLQEREQIELQSAGEAEVKKQAADLGSNSASPGDYGLQEQDLLEYVRRLANVTSFVELRFKTGIEIAPDQVASYYEKNLLPELARRGIAVPPPLDQVRSQIEEALVEERTNELLDRWLAEQRARVGVRVLEADQP